MTMRWRSLWLGAVLMSGCSQAPPLALPSRWQPGPLPLLAAPRGELADPSNTPLFQGGWRLDYGKIPQSTSLANLRFFVEAPQALELRMVGRGPSPGEVMLELNESPLQRLALDGRWREYRLNLQPSQVRTGPNLLRLRSPQECLWTTIEVVPKASPRSFANLSPDARVEKDRWFLPFGHSVEVPLRVDPDSRLELARLSGWNEPGAAPTQGSTLQLHLRSGLPPWSQEFRWRPGERLSQALHPPAPQDAVLVATALPGEEPLKPGQLGLSLEGAVLRSQQPQSQPMPAQAHPGAPRVQQPPNVVFYLVDTLRADRLSCYGHRRATSPRLDALAQDGIRFEQVMAQSSWTKPAVASIFTSLLPPDHGCLDFGDRLKEPCVTLAEAFAQSGYQVQGLVTNIYVSKSFGFGQGFQQYVCLPGASSARLHQQLSRWLKHSRDPNKPFFLYVHSLDPHSPYEPPLKFVSDPAAPHSFSDRQMRQLHNDFGKNPGGDFQARLNLAQRLYDDEVNYNDHSIGRLVDTLKSQGLYDNTLIVVTSDHGEEFLDHGMMGHINSLYQELLLVPWILKLPQSAERGTVVPEVWQQLDMAPTVLHHAGLAIPPSMQGQPWTPQSQAGRRPCFFSIDAGQDAVAFHQGEAPWKLKAQGVRLDPWVYVESECCAAGRLQPRELYDLHLDPQQRKNLAYERPEVRARLANLLNQRGWDREGASNKLKAQELYRHLQTLQYLR